jgi:hypothetical protein
LRLACANEAAVDHFEAAYAVLGSELTQCFEFPDLGVIGRDYQLAASFVRYSIPRAVVEKAVGPFHAESCLQRSGGIVDPGVDDATVVRTGLHSGARMVLRDTDLMTLRGERGGHGKSHDAAADHYNVD